MSQKRQGTGYGYVLAHFGFMTLFAGQMFSYLADRLDQFILLELTRRQARALDRQVLSEDAVMQLMTMALVIPFVLLAPLVGPVVDRFSRKSILIVTSFCQGALILSIPIFQDTAFVQNHTIFMIVVVIFLIGSFTTFFTPAKTALTAELIPSEHLMAANSLTTFAGTIMNMIGALVAAEMLYRFGDHLNLCFYIAAGIYVVSGGMFFLIILPADQDVLERRRKANIQRESFFQQIRGALRYVRWRQRALRLILLNGCFSTVAGLIYSLINAKLLGEMEARTETYGLLLGVFGLALIVGGLTMTLVHRRLPSYEGFVAFAFVFVAIGMVSIAVAPEIRIPLSERMGALADRFYLRFEDGRLHLTSAMAPIVLVGVFGGALMVYITTMLQKITPKRLHGRLFALSNLCYFTMLITTLGVGFLAQTAIQREWITLTQFGLAAGAVALCLALAAVMATEWLRFKFFRTLGWALLRVLFRLEVRGAEHVPTKGPLIIAANHASWLDAMIIGASVPRIMHFLVAAKYYRQPLLWPFMKMSSAIALPGGSASAVTGVTRAAVKILRNQRVFCIFPEGSLSHDGKLGPARDGVGLIASITRAPILPLAIIGAYEAYPVHRRLPRLGPRIQVIIGRPIDPAGMSREEVTGAIMKALESQLRIGEH